VTLSHRNLTADIRRRKRFGSNTRSLLVCGALLLLANVVYGGSYHRTRDGQTFVWRDVPARGDEATWSGKRDKDGFATGSGVLTWYKVEPTIVAGSHILDTRRRMVTVSHYSGRMVRGKFKGDVTYVNSNVKALEESSVQRANRPNPRQKASRSPARTVKAAPKTKRTPRASSEPIIVDTPELTSAPTPPAPAPEQSAPPKTEEPQTAVPSDTAALAAKPVDSAPEPAPQQSPSPRTEEPQSAVPSDAAALAAKPVDSAPEPALEQSPSPVAEEQQTASPSQTGTLVAKKTATPQPEQQGTQLYARNTTERLRNRPDDSLRLQSAPSIELPKPPPSVDAETVARLDTLYQTAVKANDAAIMDEILADDFVLVTDDGASLTKADLIKEAQQKRTTYEHHEVEKDTQKVRIWRDTAVVTALLRIKGKRDQDPFDYKVSVSETYVRTPTGWRYVFGQVSKSDDQ
jgi:ketosteroid isomerase-like protein